MGFLEHFATETVKDQGTLCPIKLILHFCRPQFTETPLESTFNEGLVASRSNMVGQFWTNRMGSHHPDERGEMTNFPASPDDPWWLMGSPAQGAHHSDTNPEKQPCLWISHHFSLWHNLGSGLENLVRCLHPKNVARMVATVGNFEVVVDPYLL